MFTTDETVGLVEWIIDDTCLALIFFAYVTGQDVTFVQNSIVIGKKRKQKWPSSGFFFMKHLKTDA